MVCGLASNAISVPIPSSGRNRFCDLKPCYVDARTGAQRNYRNNKKIMETAAERIFLHIMFV